MEAAIQAQGATSARQLLRHTLATLAYRTAKAVRGTPESFAIFSAGANARTPAQIVAHLGDLMDWALAIAKGAPTWRNSTPLPWTEEVERFFRALRAFDDYLASDQPLACSMDKLFQGPVADALTHTGQINILRRMSGSPVKGENYFRAEIVTGCVGQEQTAPKLES